MIDGTGQIEPLFDAGVIRETSQPSAELRSHIASDTFHYPPPLASTVASREWAYEIDSDTISNRPTSPQLTSVLQTRSYTSNSSRGVDLEHSDQVVLDGLLANRISSNDLLNHHDQDDIDETTEEAYKDDEDAIGEPLLSNNIRTRLGTSTNESNNHHSHHKNYDHLLDTGSGLLAGVANMANSILGAGIIGLPYALKNAGFFTGTGMVIILGFVTDWSIRLIALNSKLTGQRTYIGILETCFGFPGKAAVSFFQFVFAFGGMCAFGVIVGDTIPPVLTTLFPFGAKSEWFSFLFSRSFVITFFTITVSYPLSLYRDIGKLSKASTLALLSMVIIVFSVALGGPSVDPNLKGDPNARWTFIEPGIVEAIGVISFAFVCHHNSLLIYGSLRTPTLDRFAQVTHLSTALSVIACLVMSFSGFLSFTDRTEANILNNFPADDIAINLARVCFGLNMFTTLPLECFVCRETIETFFYPDEVFNLTRHFIYTTLLVGIGMWLSLWTCDLGVVLELTGGFAASALAFVFPAACHLKLSMKSSSNATSNFKSYSQIFKRENRAGLVTVAFGLAVMIISTVHSASKALDSHRVPKICHR